MIQNIKLLIESLFDDDLEDLLNLDDNENNILNTEGAKRLYQVDFYDKMIELLGTDKPRAWKKMTDKNNNKILCYKEINNNYQQKYVKDVERLLEDKGFKFFKPNSYFFGYIFYEGLTFKQFYQKHKNAGYYRFTNADRIKHYEQEYNNDLKELQKFPTFIQDYFKETPTLQYIGISEDEGIIFLKYRVLDFARWYSSSDNEAIIKFTNKVIYEDVENASEILKSNKEKEKQIYVLKSKCKKFIGYNSIVYNIDKNNMPVGIIKFNWAREIAWSPKKMQQNDIPHVVYSIYKKGFEYIPSYEKTHENAIYEFQKDSILLSVYKKVKKIPENDTKTYDSYICLQLTGYLEEYYKKLFNIND